MRRSQLPEQPSLASPPLGGEGLDNIVVIRSYLLGFSEQPRSSSLHEPEPNLLITVRAHVDPGSAPCFGISSDKVSSIATWLVEPAGTAPASADCYLVLVFNNPTHIVVRLLEVKKRLPAHIELPHPAWLEPWPGRADG